MREVKSGHSKARPIKFLYRLCDCRDVSAAWALATILLCCEAFFCVVIIARIPYTEIDWTAYMQEVQGFQKGERDYSHLKGDTGPLVYPAGFVYLFSWLRTITGARVDLAQYIFAALYIATQLSAMAIYIRTRSLPPWSLALLCLSRRMHSIFVLRLFNDCWAMFIAYVATLVLQARNWPVAIFLFSLAVSVKMNVLLFAPGVVAVVIKEATMASALRGVIAGVLLQLLLGAPFLLAFPKSYVQRAFEFSRVFIQKWSVNWQFMPKGWFLSPQFAVLLLLLHLCLLWSFAQRRWFLKEGGSAPAIQMFFQRSLKSKNTPAHNHGHGQERLDDDALTRIIFTANIVGVVCARSLHYQFYSWYFHMLPFALLRSKIPPVLAIGTLIAIEVVWNIYPPRAWTSALLLVLHLLVLWALWSESPSQKEGKGMAGAKIE